MSRSRTRAEGLPERRGPFDGELDLDSGSSKEIEAVMRVDEKCDSYVTPRDYNTIARNRVVVFSMIKKRPDGVGSRNAMRYRQGNLVGKSRE